jgi:hypothetical protein
MQVQVQVRPSSGRFESWNNVEINCNKLLLEQEEFIVGIRF